MRPLGKVAIVIGGYAAAAVLAYAVVSVYMAYTASPDRDQYAAMFAFGDSLLFLGVFVLAALPATGAALYFLRTYRPFWTTLSAVAIVNAGIGIASVLTFLLQRSHSTPDNVSVWVSLAVLRLLVAPVFAPILLMCGLFAPTHRNRIVLFGSVACEVVVFLLYLAVLIRPR